MFDLFQCVEKPRVLSISSDFFSMSRFQLWRTLSPYAFFSPSAQSSSSAEAGVFFSTVMSAQVGFFCILTQLLPLCTRTPESLLLLQLAVAWRAVFNSQRFFFMFFLAPLFLLRVLFPFPAYNFNSFCLWLCHDDLPDAERHELAASLHFLVSKLRLQAMSLCSSRLLLLFLPVRNVCTLPLSGRLEPLQPSFFS